MKQTSLKREYETALKYYKQTVWSYVRDTKLVGAQYHVALLAWERLNRAQDCWLKSLPFGDVEAHQTEPDVAKLRPNRLERDECTTPELLATLASPRLGTPKRRSFRDAVEEAHRLLVVARRYVDELPTPEKHENSSIDAHFAGNVTFKQILDRSNVADCFPLFPTVQKRRNNGKLTLRALEQAVKRFGEDSHTSEESRQKIRHVLKEKAISCKLLEEIRWDRFRRHHKS